MSLSKDEKAVFDEARSALAASSHQTETLNGYAEGVQRLESLGLAIPPELEHFTVIAAWAPEPVKATEARLDAVGFRIADSGSADRLLQEIWQYNNMDERQSFVHFESMALRRSYVCVGTNEEDRDYPLITVESPREMIALRDPRTHRVRVALRLYDTDGKGHAQRATMYLPDVTYWLVRNSSGEWVDEYDPDRHNLGAVPVVPFVNRHRPTPLKSSLGDDGRSDMEAVIPIADAASRALTNTQLAQETIAVPQRAILGVTKGDFVDESGKPLPVWQAYFSSVWASGNKDAKLHQFDAAPMSNFETLLTMYARIAASVTPLAVEDFGLATDNPPSAEGRRAGETKLIKHTERKQTQFGHAWEAVNRLVFRFRDGEWNDDARRMETLWRDAGTPTKGQVTDAVVKQFQTGLIDWETAQEEMGRSPEQIARMKERRNADVATSIGAGVDAFARGDGFAG